VDRRSFLRAAAWIGLGLILGAGVGLFLGWVAWPIEFSDAEPSVMEERFQRDYALMIATIYSEDDDLSTARRRLSGLGKKDTGRWVLGLAVDHILNGETEAEIVPLVKLANDLGHFSPIMEPYLSQNESEQGS
jgi:hypothetical protein